MKYKLDNVDVSIDCSVFQPNSLYRTPSFIDLRDFCLPTNNQGNTPHCVGYTVAAYFEVENWKKTHIPVQFDASKIYSIGRQYKADTPAGTKLEYCLLGLRHKNVFIGEICSFSAIDTDMVDAVKCHVHTNGVLMCAFNITDEWFDLSWKNIIKPSKNFHILGGHCVLCCGYNQDGMYIQNSWGYDQWGNYGFAIVPWKLVPKQLNYCVFIRDFEICKENMEIMCNELFC